MLPEQHSVIQIVTCTAAILAVLELRAGAGPKPGSEIVAIGLVWFVCSGSKCDSGWAGPLGAKVVRAAERDGQDLGCLLPRR